MLLIVFSKRGRSPANALPAMSSFRIAGVSRAEHQLEPDFRQRLCKESQLSGLSWEPGSRAVEQIHLRCTEGSLEWMYPARALRVVLEPNLASGRHTTVCIKPASDFQGANIYVEHSGQLQLVASPHRDISRRTASFQYELLSKQSTAGHDFKKMALLEAMCRPCDNMELLMAICSSDFVVKGSIRNVSHDSENRMSQVDVRVHKVYRQKNRIFQQEEGSGEWRGPIQTLLQCKTGLGARVKAAGFICTTGKWRLVFFLPAAPQDPFITQIHPGKRRRLLIWQQKQSF
ncbi:meteorin-like protein isoform X3 [Poecile atricapillus]|uniref:meteorin-like protein isoform X3 n=1 Tax=Poecile atricapillus TaxID=48891 RepID=UPI002739003E|nr:meteorin-like protein isoform X3 [Poecile atricapillus]